jgi:hypothetical protein
MVYKNKGVIKKILSIYYFLVYYFFSLDFNSSGTSPGLLATGTFAFE